MMAAYPEKLTAGGVIAGLPYGCAQGAGSPWVCMYVGATQTPQQWGDRVWAVRPGCGGPWPPLTVLQGSANHTVKPVNMTDLMKQWTDVHGADQTTDVSDTAAGYRSSGLSRSESARPHAPNGLGRSPTASRAWEVPPGPRRTQPWGGDTHPVRGPGPGGRSRPITGMGHGQPVDPGSGSEQCGTAGA
ncbi:alpha/beta hydrolase family protein [Streptomyces mirabilis]|uniref:hypothetical protein n=1 Tax=Streptomyces mirabilis TaxID=68239 RepID=UPI0036ED90F9